MLVLKALRAPGMEGRGNDAAQRVRVGRGWWEASPGPTPPHSPRPPRRLLIAFFYFIFKSLNKFRAGKGGRLQVPEVKYPKAGGGRAA